MSAARNCKPPSAPITRYLTRESVREQVAAVCYRINGHGVEFLLVRTRGGRWTFPKGGLEPGMTHAQSAAIEAIEEAGVHGRIESAHFVRYTGCKRHRGQALKKVGLSVKAHLCEVLYLDSPQESKRRPTWFRADKAKLHLRRDRTLHDGAELARVIDRATARILSLRSVAGVRPDALQRVEFEARPQIPFQSWMQKISLISNMSGEGGRGRRFVAPAGTRLKSLPKACADDDGGDPPPDDIKVNRGIFVLKS